MGDPEYTPDSEYRPTVGVCVVFSAIAVITVVLIIVFWAIFVSN